MTQWKQVTEMTCSADVIKYWVGRYRLEVIDPEDKAAMKNQTLICYFSSATVSLLEAGGADHGSATSLSEAYIRTDISQFMRNVILAVDHQNWEVSCAME